MDPLRLLARAFDLLRYGNSLAARSGARLQQLREEMLRLLGPEMPQRRAAIAALLRRWQARGDVAYGDLRALVERELPALASAYRAQAGTDLGRTVAASPLAPEVVGLKVDRWLAEQQRSLNLRAEAQLRLAVGQGETTAQMAARVGRVIAQRDREMGTLLRTAAVKTATASYEAGLRAAGAESYRYVAVLDSRTTREGGWHDVGCWGANGIEFRFDDPAAPRPGWHWNCRSHIEPVTPSTGGLGQAEAEAAGLDVDALRRAGEALKRAGVRFTPARTDFAAFVRSQPLGVRVEVLGGPGARRVGLGLSLVDVAQRETGQMTLEELRARL